MFGFFKRKKKQETPPPAATGSTAPNTQIHYHPELVDQLHQDHQQLLEQFGQIKALAEEGAYDRLPDALREFGDMLRGHLLTENVKLYVYLQHVLTNDPENAELMQGFRTEMRGISKAVTRFLEHYSVDDWGEGRKKQFLGELEEIGKVLVKRIETEEKILYPLYLPPEDYA